jgi:DNA-binding FadR family transcriptional regulator
LDSSITFDGTFTSRAEEVANRLAALAEGSPAATRLGTKADLRARFGVSSATMSESLRLLQARGLVTLRTGPNGGVFTAEPSGRLVLSNLIVGFRSGTLTVKNVLESREALEPAIGQLAARRRSIDDLNRLSEVLEAMERHLGEPAAYLRLNWQLHRVMAEATGNEVLSGLYSSLVRFLEDELTQALAAASFAEHRKENFELHARLVDAIRRSEETEASALAAHHAPASMLEQVDGPSFAIEDDNGGGARRR